MPFQRGIVPVLRDWGLDVTVSAGAESRGRSDFAPRGHVFHHDVIGPVQSLPSMMVSGRSDLPGPLCNFWLRRDGHVFVVALGTANHAGSGGWNGLNENREVWGTEMNNLGVPADEWPDRQIECAHRLAAACADFSNHPVSNVCFHWEWTSRKIDPHSLSPVAFRRAVADADKGGFLVGADADMVRDAIVNQNELTRTTMVNQTTRQIRADLNREKRSRELAGENTDEIVAAIGALDD